MPLASGDSSHQIAFHTSPSKKTDGVLCEAEPDEDGGGAADAETSVEQHEIEITNVNLMDDTGKRVSQEDFELLKMLGQGSFGKVFLVAKKGGRDDGRLYAMKVLTKATLKVRDRLRTKAERDILAATQNPFIVRLHYAFQTEGKLYLVLTYVRGGDLFTRLSQEVLFTETDVKLYLAEICLAFEHIHSLGIVYRDLKPENILLGADGHIMITDFGLSKEYAEVDDDSGGKTFSFCGTVEYMAPEVVSRKGHDNVADWWSFGVLMYEMLTGKLPFVDSNRKTVMKMIIQAKLEMPVELSRDAQALLRQLFRRDPTRRLGAKGADEIKKHVFFAGIDWDKLVRKDIKPPFQPTLKSELDVSHFDEEFTDQVPLDTPGIPMSATTQTVFRGFSFYDGPSPLTSTPPGGGGLSTSLLGSNMLQGLAQGKAKSVPITDEYDIQEGVLGAGTFSECRRAIQKSTGKMVAIKIIDKSKRVPSDEVEILLRYGGHPNVVSLLEVFEDGEKAYLVTELLTGGELLEIIFARGHINELEAKEIVNKLTETVKYLHSNGVVHRDLKPSNILYADDSGKPAALRIADFGFAKQLTAENGMLMTPCYTANFVAPEVLKKQGYDKACDIWSLGILLYTMLAGFPPFANQASDTPEEILARIEEGVVKFDHVNWRHVSDDAKNLILAMLHKVPDARLNAEEVLQHQWMVDGAGASEGTELSVSAVGDCKGAVERTFKALQDGASAAVALAPVSGSTLASRRRGKKPSMIVEQPESP